MEEKSKGLILLERATDEIRDQSLNLMMEQNDII
jgi:hypothetical protein